MTRFTQKNILITGAASGIGRAVALRVASEGGNVALLDINEALLAKTVKSIQSKYDVKCKYRICDVANFTDVHDAVKALAIALSGLHAVSHNAGVMSCYNTDEMTEHQWQEIININLTGTFNVNRHALPYLLKNKQSFIVNTSSIAADQPHPWLSAYSASKGAIRSFTRSLYIEYAQRGLHANCVMPGSINTNLANQFKIPQGADPSLVKILDPLGNGCSIDTESVVGAIAFLMSQDATNINGTEIDVDKNMNFKNDF